MLTNKVRLDTLIAKLTNGDFDQEDKDFVLLPKSVAISLALCLQGLRKDCTEKDDLRVNFAGSLKQLISPIVTHVNTSESPEYIEFQGHDLKCHCVTLRLYLKDFTKQNKERTQPLTGQVLFFTYKTSYYITPGKRRDHRVPG